jgi:ferritin
LILKHLKQNLQSKFFSSFLQSSWYVLSTSFQGVANFFILCRRMANERRKHNEAMVNMYEIQRHATIAGNKRRLDALNIQTLSDMQQHQGQPKKRIKVFFICSSLYI